MASRFVCVLLLAGALSCSDSCGTKATTSTEAGHAPRVRAPDEIRRDGNHLVGQGSLYLRQHAHNPVDWYPWSPEALALAKELDRPIFLSVGYASCHWCHVMEAEVFEQDDVARELNEHFVSIKVDREERPDLDAAYMAAVQTMTGSGGWPATLFLTPRLEPFFGGTYFPRERFLELVRAGAKEFTESRSAVDARSAEVHARIAADHPDKAADHLRVGEMQAIAERGLGGVDPAGGFKGRTKFPNASRWTFLLHAARKWGGPYLEPVRRTLDAMASGGIFNQVGGGFFRYTVEPTWSVPHFEKMLYVNAALAQLYLEAYAAFGEARDLAVAQRTLDFLLREMESPDGGFFASLDADSDGKEGAFYLFTLSELRSLFGEAETPAVAKLVGATERGNLDGANVLTLRPPPADGRRWETIRAKLFDARAKRVRPRRDEKIVTAWNGLAIDALAHASVVTGDERYKNAAIRAAELLWRVHRHGDTLARASTNGKTGDDAVLEDSAALAAGFLSLAQATADVRWIERALDLVTSAQRDFGMPEGGFFATRAGGPLGRRIELYDNEEPCGSSIMVANLLRVAALTGRADLYAALERTLGANAESARAAGLGMASWTDAALLANGPFYDVVIAGTPTSTTALGATWRALLPPWAVRTDVDASGPSAEALALLPPLAGKTGRGANAVAYVCVRGACDEPTGDPTKLRAQLLTGWTR